MNMIARIAGLLKNQLTTSKIKISLMYANIFTPELHGFKIEKVMTKSN